MAGWIEESRCGRERPECGGGQPHVNPNAKRIAELEKQVKDGDLASLRNLTAADARSSRPARDAEKGVGRTKAAAEARAPVGKQRDFEEWVKGGMKIPAGGVFMVVAMV